MRELLAARAGASDARHAGFADAARQRPRERGFESVRHAEPMLSLDNAYDEDELRAFDERVRKGLAEGGAASRHRSTTSPS